MDEALPGPERRPPRLHATQEGLALHDAAISVEVPGPFLEVGSYCGKSTIYLGAARATAEGCCSR